MVVTPKLRSTFTAAATWVKDNHKEANVPNSVLFRLYGLYKRSTAGACNVRVPTILVEPIARERYNSWKLASVMTEEQAMRAYVDLVRISFPAFAKAAASQLKELEGDVEALKEENRSLLEETTEMLSQLSRLQQDSIVKRGHLYKWHAEQVGFGGSKWQRRFLVLQGTSLSVYATPESAGPLRTIPLAGLVVRTEPPKKGGQYHVFALYPLEELEEDDEDSDFDEGDDGQEQEQGEGVDGVSGEGGGGGWHALSPDDRARFYDNLEEGGVVIRLSTESAADCKEWVDAVNRACILSTAHLVKERELQHGASSREGSPPAPLIEDDDDGIAPPRDLPHTDGTQEEHEHEVSSSVSPSKRAAQAAEAVLRRTLRLRKQVSEGRQLMATATPRHPSDARLSSMASQSAAADQPPSTASGSSLLPSSLFRKRTHSGEKAKQEAPPTTAAADGGTATSVPPVEQRAHKLDPTLFPPSMPMHKAVRPSVLSIEHPARDYTGYLNLAMIILGVHFSHACVDVLAALWSFGLKLPTSSLVEVPCLLVALSLVINIVLAWLIELLAARQRLLVFARPPSDAYIGVLHCLNCLWTLCFPTWVAWQKPEVPLHTFVLLFWAVVCFLKLASWSHTNWDLRRAFLARRLRKSQSMLHHSTSTLNNHHTKSQQSMLHRTNTDDEPSAQQVSAAMAHLTYMGYPQSVSLSSMGYFFFAPTLCYQTDYPRAPKIRARTVLSLVFRIVVMIAFAGFVINEQIRPIIQSTMLHVDRLDLLKALAELLRLAIPSTLVWLLFFYVYFHCTLNLFGEITRFGDRCFYKDWWNCTSFSRYWRTWNMPVHQFVVRHVYFPLLRAGASKMTANVAVFAVSAFFHELLISVPCHVLRLWAFLAMMGQIPLIYVTDHLEKTLFRETQAGNFAFWLIFCVLGQPMAVLLYYYDFHQRGAQEALSHTIGLGLAANNGSCPVPPS